MNKPNATIALIGISILLCTTGCTNNARRNDPASYLKTAGIPLPDSQTLYSCRGYGCRKIDRIELTKKQWATITKPIKKKQANAAAERIALQKVIGLFEKEIGAMTGTAEDIEGTYHQLGDFQQDCIDESTNTTLYLMTLQNKGLLHYHTVGRPEGRLPLFSGRLGPHQTAIIVETKAGQAYAVDSWFHNNGHPAEIVLLDEWKTGWRP